MKAIEIAVAMYKMEKILRESFNNDQEEGETQEVKKAKELLDSVSSQVKKVKEALKDLKLDEVTFGELPKEEVDEAQDIVGCIDQNARDYFGIRNFICGWGYSLPGAWVTKDKQLKELAEDFYLYKEHVNSFFERGDNFFKKYGLGK